MLNSLLTSFTTNVPKEFTQNYPLQKKSLKQLIYRNEIFTI